jgi:hypothetical protein
MAIRLQLQQHIVLFHSLNDAVAVNESHELDIGFLGHD